MIARYHKSQKNTTEKRETRYKTIRKIDEPIESNVQRGKYIVKISPWQSQVSNWRGRNRRRAPVPARVLLNTGPREFWRGMRRWVGFSFAWSRDKRRPNYPRLVCHVVRSFVPNTRPPCEFWRKNNDCSPRSLFRKDDPTTMLHIPRFTSHVSSSWLWLWSLLQIVTE